jgi:hypothetical protein
VLVGGLLWIRDLFCGEKAPVSVIVVSDSTAFKRHESTTDERLSALEDEVSKLVGRSDSTAATPELVVEFGPPTLDPKDPFQTAIVIGNLWRAPILDVRTSCLLLDIETPDHNTWVNNVTKGDPTAAIPKISARDRHTTWCRAFSSDQQALAVDVEVCVSYKPEDWPKREMKRVRRYTARRVDGSIQWLNRALAAPGGVADSLVGDNCDYKFLPARFRSR